MRKQTRKCGALCLTCKLATVCELIVLSVTWPWLTEERRQVMKFCFTNFPSLQSCVKVEYCKYFWYLHGVAHSVLNACMERTQAAILNWWIDPDVIGLLSLDHRRCAQTPNCRVAQPVIYSSAFAHVLSKAFPVSLFHTFSEKIAAELCAHIAFAWAHIETISCFYVTSSNG